MTQDKTGKSMAYVGVGTPADKRKENERETEVWSE